MKRKLAEWTVFAFVAAGAVFFVRWFVPWAAFQYYQATAKPVPPRLNPELRKHLREIEDRLAADRAVVGLGQSGLTPCLVLPAPVGVGPRRDKRTRGPVQDCLQLVPGGPPLNAVEVDLMSGTPVLVQTDIYLPGDPPIALTRVVEALKEWNEKFAIFLQNEYETYPTGDRLPYTYQTLWLADRSSVLFRRISKGTSYADAVYEHTATRSLFYRALEGWNGNGWDVDLPDGRILVFPEAYYSRRPQQGALVGLIEPSGASLVLNRDPDGNLQTVRATDGRWMKLGYRGEFVESLSDSTGQKADYSYDGQNRLVASTNSEGELFLYNYNQRGALTAVLCGKTHKPLLEAHYDAEGRITSLRVAGEPTFRLAYRTDAAGRLTEIDLQDDHGHHWMVRPGSCSADGCTYDVNRR